MTKDCDKWKRSRVNIDKMLSQLYSDLFGMIDPSAIIKSIFIQKDIHNQIYFASIDGKTEKTKQDGTSVNYSRVFQESLSRSCEEIKPSFYKEQDEANLFLRDVLDEKEYESIILGCINLPNSDSAAVIGFIISDIEKSQRFFCHRIIDAISYKLCACSGISAGVYINFDNPEQSREILKNQYFLILLCQFALTRFKLFVINAFRHEKGVFFSMESGNGKTLYD